MNRPKLSEELNKTLGIIQDILLDTEMHHAEKDVLIRGYQFLYNAMLNERDKK